MAKKAFRIAPEIKEQIITRIKNNGVSVADAAKEHGVSTVTIYSWLGTTANKIIMNRFSSHYSLYCTYGITQKQSQRK